MTPTVFTTALASSVWTAALVNAIYTAINTLERRKRHETPTGTPNGVLLTFGISATVVLPAESMLFVNGVFQNYTNDYTISGTTITFVVAPPTSAKIRIFFDY